MLRCLKLTALFVGAFALFMVVVTDSFAVGDAAAGKAVFETNCAACHGADGNSPMAALGVPSFANGDRLDKPFDARFESVCKGKESEAGMGAPPMQPFCGTLSEDDVRNAVAYTETLKQ
jgi:mono/diheme cytochrome c family protein